MLIILHEVLSKEEAYLACNTGHSLAALHLGRWHYMVVISRNHGPGDAAQGQSRKQESEA